MSYKSIFSLLAVSVLGAGLAACGGGSASTGAAGGSGGGGGASSSIVVQMARNSTISAIQQDRAAGNRLASVISDMLVRRAISATSDVTVYLYDSAGNLVGTTTTDVDGKAVFSVTSGTYYVCFAESTDPATDTANCSDAVDVGLNGQDEVVVVSGVTVDDGGDVTYTVSAESVTDEIAAFQDPNNAHKTIVCHKNKVTISVGTPAALYGHLGHGDTLGACQDTTTTTTTNSTNGAPGNSGNHGNHGNHGNQGNHGNPNTQSS